MKSIPRWATKVEDGMVKIISVSEKEYIDGMFKQYDVEIVTPKDKLVNALKNGDYVIGVDYNPFLFQNVFHYKNGMIEFFRFADVGKNVMVPLRLSREETIFLGTSSSSTFKLFIDTMPHYDDLIVYRKGNLLDIENITRSITSLIK